MSGVPGLEALRRHLIGGFFEGDGLDHVAAALPGRHGVKDHTLAVKHADAGWPVGLVTGEHVEIAIQSLHIDRHPGRGLAAADQHLGARSVDKPHNGLDSRDMAGDIRNVSDGDELGASAKAVLESVKIQRTPIVDRNNDKLDPDTIAQQLPRNDIGMVLKLGEHHLVAGVKKRASLACATRLMPSVAPLTKTISETSEALRKRGAVSRAASNRSVARTLRS